MASSARVDLDWEDFAERQTFLQRFQHVVNFPLTLSYGEHAVSGLFSVELVRPRLVTQCAPFLVAVAGGIAGYCLGGPIADWLALRGAGLQDAAFHIPVPKIFTLGGQVVGTLAGIKYSWQLANWLLPSQPYYRLRLLPLAGHWKIPENAPAFAALMEVLQREEEPHAIFKTQEGKRTLFRAQRINHAYVQVQDGAVSVSVASDPTPVPQPFVSTVHFVPKRGRQYYLENDQGRQPIVLVEEPGRDPGAISFFYPDEATNITSHDVPPRTAPIEEILYEELPSPSP